MAALLCCLAARKSSMGPKPHTHMLQPKTPFDATYQLTLADNLPPAINSRYLFVYKAPKTGDWQDDLTARLSKSLTSFLCQPDEGVIGLPQIAGKIYQDKTGRLSLKVTQESAVRFVVSHRNDITFESLQPEKGFPMRNLKGEVYAHGLENIPAPDRTGGLEAFSIQITYIHGGFVICVNKHHFLLDANSTGQFIQWWLQRARSYLPGNEGQDIKLDSPSKCLAMHDNSSLTLDKVIEPAEKLDCWKVVPNAKQHIFGFPMPSKLIMFIGSLVPSLKPKITNAVFRFSPSLLAELHVESSKYSTETFSKHDAVCALLWRCVTRARMFAIDSAAQPKESMMALATNGRSRLRPKMADEYFGNVAFYSPTSLPINVLTSAGEKTLADVALAIRQSIAASTSDANMRSLLQLMAAQPKVTDVVNSLEAFMGKDVMMTSWERMFKSAKDLDVGVEGASFQNMRLPDGGAFDGMGMVLPAYGLRDVDTEKGGYPGGLEVSIDLLVTHMEALKNDEEWIRYAKWTEEPDF